MNDSLKERCDLFVKNRDLMKDNFRWENHMMHPLCSSIYTEKEILIDTDKIKLCKHIIKYNTGMFSSFKGVSFIALATMLSLSSDPENKFNEVLKIYEILRSEFHYSSYLPLSAFVISDLVNSSDYERVTLKAKEIYVKMKSEHPFLTSGEDSGFAVITAISNLSVENSITEMEKCYDNLKGKFFSANAVQSLSHTLVLGEEESKIKCNKVMSIFDELKDRNCKFGTGMELSVLGLLAMTADSIEETVNDIVATSEYLNTFKGFGAFGIGKAQRIMYSAILVSQEYKKIFSNEVMKIASVNSITNMIIAQQAATAAIIASSTAAASSNSN